MLLGFFTEEAYDKLLNEVSYNSEKYLSDEEWLPEYFGGNNDYYKISSVDVNKFDPDYTPGKKSDEQINREDITNVRLLYDAFKKLTPLQASNKYMWTYLCHAVPEYRKYIRDRWMQSARTTTIETRFFVPKPGNLLNDNALSRLWWYGHLTYDESNSNPYALTEILLTSQTLATDVMDTNNRMNPERLKGVLLGIKAFKEAVGEKESINNYFRECKKYLNHYAAITTMEFLDSDAIKNLTFNQLMSIRNKEKK